MLFWAVVSDSTEEAVELFTSREEAEAIVQAWDLDEPEQAGVLRVEMIELRTGRRTSSPVSALALVRARAIPLVA
jgi:hypothetical protein